MSFRLLFSASILCGCIIYCACDDSRTEVLTEAPIIPQFRLDSIEFEQLANVIDSSNVMKSVLLYDAQGNHSQTNEYSGVRTESAVFDSMDDVVWHQFGQDSYAYDDMGREVCKTHYDVLSNGDWIKDTESISHYDVNGRLSEVQEFADVRDVWQVYLKTEYQYDEKNRMIGSQSYNVDMDGDLIRKTKMEYMYDNHDNCSRALEYVWQNSDWTPSHKMEYTFPTGFHKGVCSGFFEWKSNDWSTRFQINITKEANGNVLLTMKQGKRTDCYLYDSYGNNIEQTCYVEANGKNLLTYSCKYYYSIK